MVLQPFRWSWKPSSSATETNGAKTNGENSMMANRSALKDFLLSTASMTGDLSNITAPPFVLDQKSVVEIPKYWAENSHIFISPALSEDPAERSLLILKSFLAGIKSQCYMGHTEAEGVKKPLNAFLGELFIGHWKDEQLGTTYLVSEQVSHHPPITACRVWNPKYGVIAEGYNKQKITFSMSSLSVHIESTGFALKSLEKYNEHYLLPLPDFRVKGVLSGAPYPETSGEWYITSTSGYTSKISFSGGKGIFGGGKKHEFTASLYKEGDEKHPLYTIEGCWNTEFTIRDERADKIIETFSVVQAGQNLAELELAPIEEMDPWESRRAWHDVREAIQNNDFKSTNAAKSFLEQGQRSMRKDEERSGTRWQQTFFKSASSHAVVQELMAKIPGRDFAKTAEDTKGVWIFDPEAYEHNARGPFHPGLDPDNLKEGEERVYRNGSRASFQSSRPGTPRQSVDYGRHSIDFGMLRDSMDSPRPRASVDDRRPRASIDERRPRSSVDERRRGSAVNGKVSALEDGRSSKINGITEDAGREPHMEEINGVTKDELEPQKSQQSSSEEELRSGIAGLNVNEKVAVEDMLRANYSST